MDQSSVVEHVVVTPNPLQNLVAYRLAIAKIQSEPAIEARCALQVPRYGDPLADEIRADASGVLVSSPEALPSRSF